MLTIDAARASLAAERLERRGLGERDRDHRAMPGLDRGEESLAIAKPADVDLAATPFRSVAGRAGGQGQGGEGGGRGCRGVEAGDPLIARAEDFGTAVAVKVENLDRVEHRLVSDVNLCPVAVKRFFARVEDDQMSGFLAEEGRLGRGAKDRRDDKVGAFVPVHVSPAEPVNASQRGDRREGPGGVASGSLAGEYELAFLGSIHLEVVRDGDLGLAIAVEVDRGR